MRRAPRTFDSKCLDLAEYFYPGMGEDLQRELAADIQELIEGFGMCDRSAEAGVVVTATTGPDCAETVEGKP